MSQFQARRSGMSNGARSPPAPIEPCVQQVAPEWSSHSRRQLVARQVALDLAQDVYEEPVGDARERPEVVGEIRLRNEQQVGGLVADQMANQRRDRIVETVHGCQLVHQIQQRTSEFLPFGRCLELPAPDGVNQRGCIVDVAHEQLVAQTEQVPDDIPQVQVCLDVLGGHPHAKATHRIGKDIRERHACPGEVLLVDRCAPVGVPHAGRQLVAGLDQVPHSGVHQSDALNDAPAFAVFVEPADGSDAQNRQHAISRPHVSKSCPRLILPMSAHSGRGRVSTR